MKLELIVWGIDGVADGRMEQERWTMEKEKQNREERKELNKRK